MRMSSGRIRSINRAIAGVQTTAGARLESPHSTEVPTLTAAMISAGTVKVGRPTATRCRLELPGG